MKRLLRKEFWQAVLLSALVLLAAVSVALMSEYFARFFDRPIAALWGQGEQQPGASGLDWQFWTALFFFALSILLFMTIAGRRKVWFGSSAALLKAESDTARKVVIMGLSPDNGVEENLRDGKSGEAALTPELIHLRDEIGFEKASGTIAEMIADGLLEPHPSGRFWVGKTVRSGPAGGHPNGASHRWVQNLRALRVHVAENRLSHVFIVPSLQTAQSAQVFKCLLATMLRQMMEAPVIEVLDDNPADYDSFEPVRDALIAARKKALASHDGTGQKITDKDICIDATSGKATFSIAAALVTLNHDLLYSYVTTGEEPPSEAGGKPLFYDATVDLAAFIHDV